jgi:PD-(D/E)XK nuclease superfamily
MIKWSFSSLKDFINCPKQYHEVKILQNFSKSVTTQMQYGTEVHKALEDYTRDGTPLVKNYERFRPMMDQLLSIPGTRHPELKMALDFHRKPVSFDGDYWVRGIVDLLIVDNKNAFIVDYKTGSAKYPDPKQLKLMALMTFAHFPEVMSIKAGLLFVLHDVFVTEEYTRDDIPELWDAFLPTTTRLQVAVESGNFPPNPTPLCGWCPVTSCEFFKRRRTY